MAVRITKDSFEIITENIVDIVNNNADNNVIMKALEDYFSDEDIIEVHEETLSEMFPWGISSKQRDELRKSWFDKYGNPYIDGHDVWNDHIWRLDYELSMINMLDSCFAYGGVDSFYTTKSYSPDHRDQTYYEKYLEDFINHGGTKKEFDNMIKAQKSHYRHCKILHNSFIDNEGLSYNSIIEDDERSNYEI